MRSGLMRRFLSQGLPWLLTALLVGYIVVDVVGLFGEHTMAVDGRTDAQRAGESR